ncbi:hypothetical protein Vretimale_14370 [Volvox reticuliferus]|uniref:SLC41A/MgtE integral membrane domain-containing protein n=2 Tax=Volvox reticuliferus TaxID=1737510 RepID=A0A8J4CLL9_9CHLO|nr:hypothetical protein Vretifemale_13394 [Volvox reticuliferus]GIM10781.1 hypothetical protein Vretimale_14370 [Volvox reticuliferus]
MSLNRAYGRAVVYHGASAGEPALTLASPPSQTLSSVIVRPLSKRRNTMWPLPKKQRHLSGTVTSSQSGEKGATGSPGPSHLPSRRGADDSIVITASAVAPLLPAGGSGSGSQLPGGPLHHLHHAAHAHSNGGNGPGLAGAGGGPGLGSTYSGGQTTLPVGQLHQRPHQGSFSNLGAATVSCQGSLPYNAASTSLDEELVRSMAISSSRRGQICDGGLPDTDMCRLDLDSEDERQPATQTPASMPVIDEALTRGRWLLGLLIVQSTSSFVLDAYQDLLRDHLVVTLFLTMLVGAGGNAGNQSAIKVIRGLATGAIRPSWPSARATMRDQALVGLLLGTGLSVGGFVRVYATHGDVANAAAISISLFLIVMTSVVLGTGLPFALARAGVDPANAGTSIQVLMDILGVAITCVTCHFVLVQLALGVGAAGAAGVALPS